MFGLSFIEAVAVGVIALIVIGPKQLPEVARTIARVLNEFKRTSAEFTDSFYSIRTEVNKTVDQTRLRLEEEAGVRELKKNAEALGEQAARVDQALQQESLSSSTGQEAGGETGKGEPQS